MIALSWSRLTTFQQCPRKFHLQFISKSFKEEEKSIHLIKGEQLHKQLEDYVIAKNGGAPMPLGFSPEVRETLPYVDKLFSLYNSVHPEAQVACNIEWKPVEWFDKSTAWRAIWDVVGLRPQTCFIGDYKSGRIYPYGQGFGQLHLSAVVALERFQDVPEVNAAYIYVEHRKVTPIKVTREQLSEVRDHFNKEFEKVQMEKTWDPTPNEFCKYCQATKAQCQFSRKL
jgi:CRISPR/Cas system-associated exonuclease Cas4 (RecB family)